MTSLTLAPHWLKLRGQKKSLAATRSLSSAAERGGLRGGETRRESLRKHRARFEPTTFGFGEPLPSVAPEAHLCCSSSSSYVRAHSLHSTFESPIRNG